MASQSRIAFKETIAPSNLTRMATITTFMIFIAILYNLQMFHLISHLPMPTLHYHPFMSILTLATTLTPTLWALLLSVKPSEPMTTSITISMAAATIATVYCHLSQAVAKSATNFPQPIISMI